MDCISSLPIWELTMPTNIPDSAVTERILAEANWIIPVSGYTFIADKAYDVIAIYNYVRNVYQGDVVISLTSRNSCRFRMKIFLSLPLVTPSFRCLTCTSGFFFPTFCKAFSLTLLLKYLSCHIGGQLLDMAFARFAHLYKYIAMLLAA